MIIRDETQADHGDIRSLNQAAFGGGYEAALVDRLRSEELVRASLVAVKGDVIVGHILFSALSVTMDGWTVRAAALAPLAVAPALQRRGIGSALVRSGLDSVTAQGFEAVFVLGHTAYYPRFGFSAAAASKLASHYAGDAFMALDLTPDALRGTVGTVTYPDAFEAD